MVGVAVMGEVMLIFASLSAGPVQFDKPIWLVLIPVTWLITIWLGRKSLSGLGTLTRRVALAIRLVVLVVLMSAIAEPQWRRVSEDVSVTVVLDASRSVPRKLQTWVQGYLDQASEVQREADDRLGMVTAARGAYVQQLPSRMTTILEQQHIGAVDGTNLAEALRLGIAVMPEDAANRIVLATDGNETEGSLLQAAEAARALGVPIDVLPLRFTHESEVMVDRLDAPATARMGETVSVRTTLTSTREITGRLSLLVNGDPIDLDPDDGVSGGLRVTLRKGTQHLQVPITVMAAGPQEFEAIFEPDDPDDDSMSENNRSMTVTFVSGEGRVLVYADAPEDAKPILDVLMRAKLDAVVHTAETGPDSLAKLAGYDAVVMINQSAYSYSEQQQELLRQYVHDSGGGLVMIGGPDSFGAGGWIGSPLEDALPIQLDPPQKKQMPKGALVLVMHSIEMPQGRYFGEQTAKAAIEALTRLDMAGIVEFRFSSGVEWVHPLAEVGNRESFYRAIKGLQFGDMPDMAPSIRTAYQGLVNAKAGQKHIVVISDGDPSPPSASLLQKLVDAGITVSTVGVFPHNPGDLKRLKYMADFTGGRAYEITTKAGLGSIVQIFVKEAQTVKRSLIWEGTAFSPEIVDGSVAGMRGIGSPLPAIRGYVVAADREGLAQVMLRGKENDPVAAQWQYGLGRSVAFLSDASTRWASDWVAWSGFATFWEQHIRWAMRPSGSASVRVQTYNEGDHTIVNLRAIRPDGTPMNFAQWKGRVSTPDGTGMELVLRQVGPGRYEGSFASPESGSYVTSMRYIAPSGVSGGTIEGSVQAAISRPFADEFRVLEDNTALLEQVRSMTGGRTLSNDPDLADLWSRENLKKPISTRPIWMLLALIGVGTFLIDVGVRRVRLDLRAMGAAAVGLFQTKSEKSGAQLASLRAAKSKAQSRIKRKESAAGRKFEASDEELKQAAKAKRSIAISKADEGAPIEQAKPKKKKPESDEQEQGMSRLLKAKKRAHDDMDES